MKWWAAVAAGCAAGLAVVAADPPRPVAFTKADLGRPPAGWSAAKTGAGEGSVWKVTADDSAPSRSGFVLTQTAAGPNGLFNLCLRDAGSFRDGELSVAVKALAGQLDQGGGLVWRCRDADNYYLCRYNPLEENLRVYTVVAGKRTQLATKEKLAVPVGKWFTVGVRHRGRDIACSLNGETHLTVSDATFPDVGRVGVWSKADAVSSFDQLLVVLAAK